MIQVVRIDTGKSLTAVGEEILRAAEEGLDLLATMAQSSLKEPTSGWEHKVEFVVEREPLKRSVYTTDEIYGWVNDGTYARTIVPKRPGGVLRFGVPFSPKTARYGALAPQAGGYETDVVYVRKVNFPGITGRHWDNTVASELEEKGPETIQQKINAVP